MPEDALYGSAGSYLHSLTPEYRVPVCTMVLRFLADLRALHHDDGTMLMALAKIETQLTPVVMAAAQPVVIPSTWIMPPTPQ